MRDRNIAFMSLQQSSLPWGTSQLLQENGTDQDCFSEMWEAWMSKRFSVTLQTCCQTYSPRNWFSPRSKPQSSQSVLGFLRDHQTVNDISDPLPLLMSVGKRSPRHALSRLQRHPSSSASRAPFASLLILRMKGMSGTDATCVLMCICTTAVVSTTGAMFHLSSLSMCDVL